MSAGSVPRKGPAGRPEAPLPGATPADGWGRVSAAMEQEIAMHTDTSRNDWTDNTLATLRRLWEEKHSTAKIGRRMGISKNAIVGKARRIGLPSRPSPIKPSKPGETRAPRLQRPPVPRLADMMPLRGCCPDTAASAAPATRPAPSAPATRQLASVGTKPCCWPLGEPGTASFRFCEELALTGKPYCETHCATAYARPRADVGQAAAEPARAGYAPS